MILKCFIDGVLLRKLWVWCFFVVVGGSLYLWHLFVCLVWFSFLFFRWGNEAIERLIDLPIVIKGLRENQE